MKLTEEQKKIVEDNIGLVYDISNKYINLNRDIVNVKGLDRNDLVQIGFEALCISTIRFDDKRGVKFSTYAYRCIYLSISDNVDKYNQIKIPEKRSWGAHVHQENICELKSIYSKGVNSLDTPFSIDNEADGTLADIIKDDSSDIDDIVDTSSILNLLTKKEINILKKIISGYSQTEISLSYNTTQATVSRWIKAMRVKLQSLESNNLESIAN